MISGGVCHMRIHYKHIIWLAVCSDAIGTKNCKTARMSIMALVVACMKPLHCEGLQTAIMAGNFIYMRVD